MTFKPAPTQRGADQVTDMPDFVKTYALPQGVRGALDQATTTAQVRRIWAFNQPLMRGSTFEHYRTVGRRLQEAEQTSQTVETTPQEGVSETSETAETSETSQTAGTAETSETSQTVETTPQEGVSETSETSQTAGTSQIVAVTPNAGRPRPLTVEELAQLRLTIETAQDRGELEQVFDLALRAGLANGWRVWVRYCERDQAFFHGRVGS